jgi:hypothetical protein
MCRMLMRCTCLLEKILLKIRDTATYIHYLKAPGFLYSGSARLWFSYVSVNSEDQDLINLLAELRQDFLKENYEYLVRRD